MIKFSDGAVLALTKLRTRPVRTIITILLASLLFGILVAASLIMTGALASVDSFRKDGLTSRYIVEVSKPIDTNILSATNKDPILIAKAKKQYEQLVEAKIAEAKRLGVSYSQASERPPYSLSNDGKPRSLIPGDTNGIAQALLAEKFGTMPSIDRAQLQSIAGRYDVLGIINSHYHHVPRGASLKQMRDGVEVFYDESNQDESRKYYVREHIDGNMMIIAPPQITSPYMLPGNGNWKPDGTTLPMVLPYDTVEQLLNLKKLPDAASVSDKLHRLESVRDQAATLTVPLCYRNSDSSLTVQQTIQQQTYIKTQKGSKDYIEPSIIYNLPSNTSCANPTIASDTRTASEKGLDAKQKGFDEKFGHVNNPISKIITVKVVGISPASATTTSGQPEVTPNSSLDDVVNNLLQTSGIGQAIPQTLYEQLPKDKRFDDIVTYEPIYIFGPENNNIFYVEFANSTDAQRFIREQGCTTQYDNTCQPADHPYHLSLAFSNGAAIDDIQTKAGEWFNYALIGIVTLAAIIMWIAVGRTMADSRRETAIFRAIGFKRGDIASTYILYTAMLSTLIAVFAVGIGTLGAYIVDRLYAPDLTVQAQYGFGALDLTKQVSLIGIDYRQLGLVLIACLATGLLSVIIPLLRNVRRNPIRDMRDE